MAHVTITPESPLRAHAQQRSRHSAGLVGGAQSRRWSASVLAVIGEVMVTAGALLGLLVVWELFWTDVGANRDQASLVSALEVEWDIDTLPIPVLDTSGGPPVYEVTPADLIQRTDPAPILEEPRIAKTFATMYVPRWGLDYVKPISQGVSRRAVLDPLGIGHYPDTAMPGAVGNFAVAAHRTTYGKPFADIDRLRVGDPILIRTENTWYVYTVTEYEIVRPNHVSSIAVNPFNPGVAHDNRYITLTTCHPRYSAVQRYIVHGELAYWAPTGEGFPAELIPAGAETNS